MTQTAEISQSADLSRPTTEVTDPHSCALLTDHYELTMLQAALVSGAAHRPCVFEVFARRLPEGRRYGVVAGTGRLLDLIRGFRFGDAELAALERGQVVDAETLRWLAGYRFTGDVWGYGEGECYLPGSPVLTVTGSFAEAVLLETLVLSVLNHDSAVAAAASRMTTAAAGRPCLEMGSRRTHEEAAVAAARAAYLAGFVGTSNLAAGARFGVPTIGTAAHAFMLVHDDEEAAFRAQVESLGANTTLLVDTFDVAQGVAAAIRVAGTGLGAVRLDSGDLLQLAEQVRRQLDGLGATRTKITVTSDLDEFAIAALGSAPVDSYGVGTSLVTGSGAPTAGMVYKLVARADAAGQLQPVAKHSDGKVGVGGRKWAGRRLDRGGVAVEELLVVGAEPAGRPDVRPLQVALLEHGEPVAGSAGRSAGSAAGFRPGPGLVDELAQARDRHEKSRAQLPPTARQLSRGEPAIRTRFELESR